MTAQFTISDLNIELTTDPAKVGYANTLPTSSIATAALGNAQNSVNGTGTYPSLTHDQFALMIAPVVMELGSSTTALQAKWTPMLQLIGGVSTVLLTPAILGMINALSADFPAQLPASAIAAITTRPLSRFEALWGFGTTVTFQQIDQAMGRM